MNSARQPASLRPSTSHLHQLRLRAGETLEAAGHQIVWRNYDIPGDRGYDMSRARCANRGCVAVWLLDNIGGGLSEYTGSPIGPCPSVAGVRGQKKP
jgi:hypothetical protein